MTVSNHILVGSAIALSVNQPVLAFPLAFASHFVLDSLPHFGYGAAGGYREAMKHKLSYITESLDFFGLVLLLRTINYSDVTVFTGAILAISPDFEWPYRYILFERKGRKPPETLLTKFHQRLQWGERPWGIFIEIGFYIIGFTILTKYILR